MGKESKEEKMGWIIRKGDDKLIQEKSAIKSKWGHSQQIRQFLIGSRIHKNKIITKKINF